MAKQVKTVYGNLKSRFEDAKDKLQEVQTDATEYVEEHPLKVTLAAFGIGVAVGAILAKLLERK